MDLFRKKPINAILNEIKEGGGDHEHVALKRNLSVTDLTAFGIAAIVGAGIFSTIGEASYAGGPAVILLFIFTAIACTFAGFAYAEFASMIPVSGSAYTYSYAAFGELVAWIIGWDLLIEYAIGNIAVAISWSDYFTSFLGNLKIPALGIMHGIHLPEWATMDYLSAYRQYSEIVPGTSAEHITGAAQDAYVAWTTAPTIGGFHLIADIPALAITVLITWLVYRGIKESKTAGNIMVLIKLIILLVVISVGAGYITTSNWTPFAPNGIKGVMQGVAGVFFAYIGFDAISTTAEECKNPQRDLPRSMFYSIIICTILYVAIALVLTGMVSYKEFYNVGDPLSFVFEKLNMQKLAVVVSFSAIVATASVLLVFQLGQPRIWLSMSRDGLLPPIFSRIHPKFRTPSFSTIVTGFMVAVPALFLNLSEVTALTSIGTLFAFVLVCGGVLKLQTLPNPPERKFKTPYVNSKYIAPIVLIATFIAVWNLNGDAMKDFFKNRKLKEPEEFVKSLNDAEIGVISTYLVAHHNDEFSQWNIPTNIGTSATPVQDYVSSLTGNKYKSDIYEEVVRNTISDETKMFDSGWEAFRHNIPMWIFIGISLLITWWCITKNLSLIPVLGLISCLYLMVELGVSNWYRFGIWLAVGLVIYFGYSYKRSKLNVADYKGGK